MSSTHKSDKDPNLFVLVIPEQAEYSTLFMVRGVQVQLGAGHVQHE